MACTRLPLTLRAAAAVLALGISSPAAAEWETAKSRAILGGEPSRLERILAEQQGRTLARTVAPASRVSLPIRRAVEQFDSRPMIASKWTGRPDLFGSVALRVERTSLDGRWKHAMRKPLSGAAYRAAQDLRSVDAPERIRAVNAYVNASINFTDDSRQYGRADVWTAADDTFRRGRGDCEDYAIAKLQMLRSAGISAEDLYFVLVRDLVRAADHAVLVVRSEGRSLVLDNSTDRIIDMEAVQDYRPIFTFAATSTWTHGYRRAPAQPDFADTELAATVAKEPVALALDQRSRSASLRAFMTGFSR